MFKQVPIPVWYVEVPEWGGTVIMGVSRTEAEARKVFDSLTGVRSLHRSWLITIDGVTGYLVQTTVMHSLDPVIK